MALLDLLHAKVEGVLVLRDPPSQVHVHKVDPAFQELLAKAGEYEPNQVVALRLHVPKCRGDEDSDRFPRFSHCRSPV